MLAVHIPKLSDLGAADGVFHVVPDRGPQRATLFNI
jgi:hypothetical protein